MPSAEETTNGTEWGGGTGYGTGTGYGAGSGAGTGSGIGSGAAPDILNVTQVGVYATTILSCASAADLTDWLDANGYSTSTALSDTIQFYVNKDWNYFVCMKISSNVAGGYAATSTVQFSFNPPAGSPSASQVTVPMRISQVSFNAGGVEVLTYVFNDHEVTCPNGSIEYGNFISSAAVYSTLGINLPNRRYYLTKTRILYTSEGQMNDDLFFSQAPSDSIIAPSSLKPAFHASLPFMFCAMYFAFRRGFRKKNT